MRIFRASQFEKRILRRVMSRGEAGYLRAIPSVRGIIARVKQEGDRAVLDYTQKFDGVRLSRKSLTVKPEEFVSATKKLTGGEIRALKFAARNIERFHRAQLRKTWSIAGRGFRVGQVMRPLESVGVYVPGGRASYPSTVLMCALPARAAGVGKVYVCTPPSRDGSVNAAVLVAARIAGVKAVFKAGGAQAIAAMAYGTDTIPKVQKIVGPGNVYVTAAKVEVSRDVAIDLPAGPSEIAILADESANPSFIASDMLAQAEHDPDAWSILLTTSWRLAKETSLELKNQLVRIRKRKSLRIGGNTIAVVGKIGQLVDYVNRIAPEHLEIHARRPEAILDGVMNAGAVFLGDYSPVALGDYSAGTNHVLPTGGYAKMYSSLSTLDFVKRISFVNCSRRGMRELDQATVTLAETEGLYAHAESIRMRGA